MSGKNSADIRLWRRRDGLCYSKEHIDTFLSLSPVTVISLPWSPTEGNGKRVIGAWDEESSSHLLINNCDEVIYYEDWSAPWAFLQ